MMITLYSRNADGDAAGRDVSKETGKDGADGQRVSYPLAHPHLYLHISMYFFTRSS